MRLLDESQELPDRTAMIDLTAEDDLPPYTALEQEQPTPPSSDTSFDLGTPELQIYESQEALLQAAYAHGRSHGYDVARKKPKKNAAGEQRYFRLCCTKHGSLDNTRRLKSDDRTRVYCSTKKTGCKFYLIANAVDGGAWHLRPGTSLHHNHPPDLIENLPGHRQRDMLPLMQHLTDQIEGGTSTRAIVASMRD